MSTPVLAERESVAVEGGRSLTYGRWVTVHEHRNVDPTWFDRVALRRLTAAAHNADRTVRAGTLKLTGMAGYRYVLRKDGPTQARNGSMLGRWEPCHAKRAEVFYRTYEVKLR